MLVSSLSETDLILGIDIGGTKCAAVLGDSQGNVHGRMERATKEGLGAWPEAGPNLLVLVNSLCEQSRITPAAVRAIGISCGGPLNSSTGVILSPPNLPGWVDAPIRDFFVEQFRGRPVYVENDANATALAELRWGAGKGVANFAYLTCGTGIGAGIILNGALFRGKADFAGEIGHAVIIPDGPLCLCGKKGCLEAIASGGAIGRMGADVFGKKDMSGRDVILRSLAGDTAARKIVDDAAYYLGIGISNLLQTLDLETVILGSLAVYAGDEYLRRVKATVNVNTWPAIAKDVKIVRSGLGDRTQDLAALAVALPMVN